MKSFLRLVKAVALTLMVFVIALIGLCLLAWTKGLFVVLAIFGVLVYAIYKHIEYREHSMRKEDRKWGV